MKPPVATSTRPLVLLAVVLAAVMFVFPLLVQFSLLDPDEGLHGSIALGMVESGDYVTPHFLGRPFLDKPIFYFWVQAGAIRLLGANEMAVRLPGLMFGLLGAVTTGLLAWRMFDRRIGLIAGILYSTTILPTAMAQAAAHDVALVPWVNLALLMLWECSRRTPCAIHPENESADNGTRSVSATNEQRHTPCACYAWACILAAGFFLGLSILTKGLMGVAVVGIAYGGYVLLSVPLLGTSRAVSPTRAKHCLFQAVAHEVAKGCVVLLVAAVVAAPWYLAAESQNPGFLRYYFLDRHLLGLASDTQPHSNQPWWYYLPILLGGGLPWIGYLPILVRRRSTLSLLPSPFPLLCSWLLGWTVFLTCAQSKLATYLWPAFPPMAILAAVVWSRFIDGTLSDAARRSFSRTFVWSSWGGPLVLPVAVFAVGWVYWAHFTWSVWALVGLAAALTPLPLVPWYAGRRQRVLVAAALSLALQFVVVMTVVLPPVAETVSARVLAQHFNRLGKLPTRLVMAEERPSSLVFYLTPKLRAGVKKGQIRYLLRDQPPRLRVGDVVTLPEYGVARSKRYLDLGDNTYESVGRYRLYHIKKL